MSVCLWTYGNHSIPFEDRMLTDSQLIVNRLNALHLEDTAFLREMCERWHSMPDDVDAKYRMEEQERLKQSLRIHGWEFDHFDDHYHEYNFVGPFGLEISLTRYYVEIHAWTPRYLQWYLDENASWRNGWRSVFRQIIHALGGEYALYYPDNMFELSCFTPLEHDDLTLDELIELTRREYPFCVDSFPDAVDLFRQDIEGGLPFVVDRFEDHDQITTFARN